MTSISLSAVHRAGLADALAGRYRLERELGAGGMATVWLAEDLRHARRVAIKVLHPELSAVLGPERFLAEIRTTAGLQHPHILPLFDSGSAEGLLYYVMPYVEGETLRARLERERQLPVADAAQLAREVADALQYAHERGVVHRDIKPENILLQGGHALVADFGIALAVQHAGGTRMTQTGLSLGTPQYMAPEQAMGEKAIDARADVYALGAVTYEMLAGEPPFSGPTVQAIVAKVLAERPTSLGTLRNTVTPALEAAVLGALARLPADRPASAAAFAATLVTARGPAGEPSGAPGARPVAARGTAPSRAVLVSLGATCAAAIALAAWGWLRAVPVPEAPTTRFTVAMPEGMVLDNVYAPLTISHDGRTIVFRALVNDTIRLVRRAIDQLEVVPIPGTEGGGWPTFSPDDRWLAFRGAGTVRRVSRDGGPPVAVGTVPNGGVSWATNDSLLLDDPDLRLIPLSGGEGRVLAKPDYTSRPGEMLRWPRVLPDAETILYVSWTPAGLADARIGVASRATGETKVLDVAGTWPLGVVDGHLLYVSGTGEIMAVPFDLPRQTVTGAPRALLPGIDINEGVGAARAALADSGTLVYLTRAGGATGRESHLVALEPDGSTRELLAGGNIQGPVWSPDGRRIALQTTSPQGQRKIGIFDVTTGAYAQLPGDGNNQTPTWAPDGRRIVFHSTRSGRPGIWWQPADGNGAAEQLHEFRGGGASEGVISPDGRWLVFLEGAPGAQRVVAKGLVGDSAIRPIVPEGGDQTTPALSPDGKWIAYALRQTGGRQVFVRPFPGPGGATQVSLDGGDHPVWGGDGRSLYFVSRSRELVAASLESGATMAVTNRRTLFTSPYLVATYSSRPPYAVSPDGKRFVGYSVVNLTETARLVVVTNWLAELRRLLAVRQ